MQTTLIAFDGALKNLHTLTQQIEVYLRSDKPQELARISTEVQNVLRSTEYSRTELRRLDPMLESAKRGIDDQERYKILLKQNMEVLEAEKRMKDTENEIADLESRRSDIEGHDSVCYDYQAAKESKEELQQRKANYDGRFSSHVEQIHALKVRSFLRSIGLLNERIPFTF